MQVVGILGGMGPLASAAFVERLTRLTAADRDQDHIPLVLVSRSDVPDRTAYILGLGPDPRPALIAGAASLRAAGADLLVIPCNTANVWISEVALASRLRPVPWLDITVQHLADRGIRRVGLLATTGTVQAGVYHRLLTVGRIDCVVPGPSRQEGVMSAIYGVKAGLLLTAARSALAAAADELVGAGAEIILLGCTELPLAMDGMRLPIPVVDPSDVVARHVIGLVGARLAGAHVS